MATLVGRARSSGIAAAAAAATLLAACAVRPPGEAPGASPSAGLAVRRQTTPATGRVLVARAGLADSRFERTVVLLVEAAPEGAWGLIVNRPTDLELSRALPGAGVLRGLLHFGGPVDPHRVLALVRTSRQIDESRPLLPGVRLCWSLEVLQAVAADGVDCRVFAGYAGWGPGQLDAEIARGDWSMIDCDEALLFDRDGPALWELLHRRAGTLVVTPARRRGPLPEG